jgi:hypothetical protein
LKGGVYTRFGVGKTASSIKNLLIKCLSDDSREAAVSCFSSLSRCLSVMTAIRLTGLGLRAGALFLADPSGQAERGGTG